jgi:hypothetical protein
MFQENPMDENMKLENSICIFNGMVGILISNWFTYSPLKTVAMCLS